MRAGCRCGLGLGRARTLLPNPGCLFACGSSLRSCRLRTAMGWAVEGLAVEVGDGQHVCVGFADGARCRGHSAASGFAPGLRPAVACSPVAGLRVVTELLAEASAGVAVLLRRWRNFWTAFSPSQTTMPTIATQATRATTPMAALLARKVRKSGNSMPVGQDYASDWLTNSCFAEPPRRANHGVPHPVCGACPAWRVREPRNSISLQRLANHHPRSSPA
jgi:hypothetical protein